MTATVCFERKSNICIAKFGNLGANGLKWSKFLVENVIFGIADPDLPIQYATFMDEFEYGVCVYKSSERVIYS